MTGVGGRSDTKSHVILEKVLRRIKNSEFTAGVEDRFRIDMSVSAENESWRIGW